MFLVCVVIELVLYKYIIIIIISSSSSSSSSSSGSSSSSSIVVVGGGVIKTNFNNAFHKNGIYWQKKDILNIYVFPNQDTYLSHLYKNINLHGHEDLYLSSWQKYREAFFFQGI